MSSRWVQSTTVETFDSTTSRARSIPARPPSVPRALVNSTSTPLVVASGSMVCLHRRLGLETIRAGRYRSNRREMASACSRPVVVNGRSSSEPFQDPFALAVP